MVVKNLWNVIQSAKSDPTVFRLQTTVEKIILDGYPLGILLSMFTDFVIHNAGRVFWLHEQVEVSDEKKASICLALARADKAACDGCDEELLLLSTCCEVIQIL